MDFGSIFQFLAPILQAVIGPFAQQGAQAVFGEDRPQRQAPPQMASAPGPGTPGLVGAGQTSAPSGLNFSGGFTGGAPADPSAAPQGPPSSGFTTLGYPTTQQGKLRRSLNDHMGFQGI